MDFFAQQEESRRQSRTLVWRFIFANLIVGIVLYSAIMLFYLGYTGQLVGDSKRDKAGHKKYSHELTYDEISTRFFEWKPFLVINFTVFLVIGLATLSKFRSLSRNGGTIAQMLGGRQILPNTNVPLERRFVNVVEEMAISAGMPVPEIYVLGRQEGINAFAAGPTPERSAIAVTKGALERLNRDELQGVVAHEFAHILHNDVRLNIRLAAYIYGLVILVEVGLIAMKLAGRRGTYVNVGSSGELRKSSGGGNPVVWIAIFGFLIVAIGSIGKLVSVLLSAAISRKREYLADATAVQLTRNPGGLSGALKKIGGYEFGGQVDSAATQSLSHFFLSDIGTSSFLSGLTSTHPPLTERIRKLDPNFKGQYPESSQILFEHVPEKEAITFFGQQNSGQGTTSTQTSHAEDIDESVLHAKWAPPLSVVQDLHEAQSAELILFAMLMSNDTVVRVRQTEFVATLIDVSKLEEATKKVASLDIHQQLSCILLALPTLQGEGDNRLGKIESLVDSIVEIDRDISLFELLASMVLYYGVDQSASQLRLRSGYLKEDAKYYSTAIQAIVCMAIDRSSGSEDLKDRAFEIAVKTLGFSFGRIPSKDFDMSKVKWAFSTIRQSAPNVRKAIFDAVFAAAQVDDNISIHEEALLRMFALLLRVPMSL